MKAYCIKCKTKTETKHCEECKDKRGHRRMKGLCKTCGTKKSVYLL